MIDPSVEQVFPFAQIKGEVASRPSLASAYRWTFKGVRGVKLESILIGGATVHLA